MIRIAGTDFEPQRIFCIGQNYPKETNANGRSERSTPVVFLKPRTSLVFGNRPIRLRQALGPINFEGELVLVIGSWGQGLTPKMAYQCIAGVTMGLDLTRRSLQGELSSAGLPWDEAKAFDDSAAVGTFGVPFDTQRKLGSHFSVALNDEHKMLVDTGQMYFDPLSLVAHISISWRLMPGDLIFTGTPRSAGTVAAGDRVTIEADDIGTFDFDFTSDH